MVEFVNTTLGVLTVVGQVIIITIFLAWVFKTEKWAKIILTFVADKFMQLSLFVTLCATLGSLFYSEIAHYEPCTFCWYQRILMYPQVLLFGVALKKKDRGVASYTLLLSVVGFVIAAYHYLMQVGVVSAICGAVGYSASCSQRFVMQFGYITIPMMSLTAFALILIYCLVSFSKVTNKRRGKK